MRREIGTLSPNNQRQDRTLHIQKDVLPYALQSCISNVHFEILSCETCQQSAIGCIAMRNDVSFVPGNAFAGECINLEV